jgi:hypothetical protein
MIAIIGDFLPCTAIAPSWIRWSKSLSTGRKPQHIFLELR